MFIFMPVTNCLNYCRFIVSFEIKKCKSYNFVFHFQDCFDYPRFLEFSYEFLEHLVNICNAASWDFDSDCAETAD